MISSLLPVDIQECQGTVRNHRASKTLLKTTTTTTTTTTTKTTTTATTTTKTTTPTTTTTTTKSISSIQTSVQPSKRYGTYVKHNESCLKTKCVYDAKSPDIWAREKVIVKIVPENETDTFVKKTLMDNFNKSDIREEFELLLTPSIITVWAYELGYALTEGK